MSTIFRCAANAIRVAAFGAPDVLQVGSVDFMLPSSGEVLVKVLSAGVNPVETYMRSGAYAALPRLPYTPGTDGAGIVEAAGAETAFHPGDRVWLTGSLSGTYAQYALCRASDVHRLPDSISFDGGAALGIPFRTAYRALVLLGEAKQTDSLLIHGASGSVGLAAIQFARSIGIRRIIGTSNSQAGRDLILSQGAHEAVPHGEHQGPVDLIIENLANANLGTDLKIIAKHGRIVVVGSRGDITINPRDIMRSECTIRGMVGAGSESDVQAADNAIQLGLERGLFQPVVGLQFPLSKAAEAHVEVINHSAGSAGKIVLRPHET